MYSLLVRNRVEVAYSCTGEVFDGFAAAIRRGALGPGARAGEHVRVTLHELNVASASFDGWMGDAA